MTEQVYVRTHTHTNTHTHSDVPHTVSLDMTIENMVNGDSALV